MPTRALFEARVVLLLELSALAIVALFVVLRTRRDPYPGVILARLATMAVAAFLAESTVIWAYGFYTYSPRWSVFVGPVPLPVILIWPVVIHSAWDLAGSLVGPAGLRRVLAVAGIVLTDAALIEPIAVQADLWHWHQPGLFAVPPIGILGWALFAGAAAALLEPWRVLGARALALEMARLLVIPVVATHGLLLLAWWSVFRWVNAPIPAVPVVVLAWGLAAALAFWAVRRWAGRNVPRADLLLRAPGAIFFFVLLAQKGREHVALVAFAAAFVPPYLALFARRGAHRPNRA